MAKTLNSVSFTVLLVVLAMVSTGNLKSVAGGTPDCFNKGVTKCSLPAERVFYAECGPAPFTEGTCECCKCCMETYGSPPVCYAVVEGSDNHCHCYKHV